MNVLANCRKHFSKDLPGPTTNALNTINPKWEAFLKDWASLLDSATEDEYTSCLVRFCTSTAAKEAIAYVEKT